MTGLPTSENDSPAEGEMGRLVRSLDWSATPLGPVESWSPALRTMVRTMLANRLPMLLWWGPRYISIYNDPYRPMLGNKHPWALGQPVSECWKEIWHILKPLIDTPFHGGPATWNEDLQLIINRLGFAEETHWLIAYSPVPDESAAGGIGGVLATVHEISEKVVGERRLRTLRDLAAECKGAKSELAVCRSAAKILAGNPHDVPFAMIYRLPAGKDIARLEAAAGIEPGSAASPASVRLQAGAGIWSLAEVARSGRAAVISDLSGPWQSLPAGAWNVPARNVMVLPVLLPGQSHPRAILVAAVSPMRMLDEGYHTFFELVATQLASAFADARALEEERRRAEALAEIDRAKTLFFSNVSHEFRTPLTLMLGPVEDLLARSTAELSPAAAAQLRLVNRNGLRLLRLVNTLLDFSRIEAGRAKASYRPTDLAALTLDLASVFRAAVERAGLRLTVDCPPLGEPVYVDRDMWEKIVLNLLSNAFKFTFEGEITVLLRPVGGHAELRVRDTGTGIPAAEMPRLFERFHRVRDARGRTHEGSGIGLALVQELVRLHGGSIAAESVVGRGALFIVAVPLGSAHLPPDQIDEGRAPAPAGTGAASYVEEALRWLPDDGPDSDPPMSYKALSAPAAGSEQSRDGPRPRVLVADDNADMRRYLVHLLAGRYRIETAADGEAALAASRQEKPDLVLTDVMMPRLDGFGLLRELRADPLTRDIPVIMLSARAGEDSRIEGMEAGADDYLIKPFSARELLARVGAHLQIARIRRESEQAVRESEARFRHMADHAPVMVWITEPDGVCSYLSKSWYEFTGQVPETGLEFGWLDALHEDDRVRVRDAFLKADARREAFRLEYRLRRSDGRYRWVLAAAAPRIAADHAMLGYIGSVIDITERKQAESQLNELIERCPFGIYIVDSGFRIAHMNANSQQNTFANVRPVIGRPFDEAMRILWPENVAAEIIKIFRRTLDTGEAYYSKNFINPRARPGAGRRLRVGAASARDARRLIRRDLLLFRRHSAETG